MAGLYLHIPYCHAKCAYCDFYSTPNTASIERLTEALGIEYLMRNDEIASSPVRTIYMGGGTPSILPLNTLSDIASWLPLAYVSEFTIEANPEDVSLDKARAWRDLGINRVSMGVQSLIDSELALIGRRHTAQQAIEAYHVLRQAGFQNISLDLIYGLPRQTFYSWQASIERLLALQPEHFSAYILSYEPNTRLHLMLQRGQVQELPEDDIIKMYQLLCDTAVSHGYEHYEISNFSLPGRHSQHNSSYWDNTPYLGLGPSAHSYDGRLRRANPAQLQRYLELIGNGMPAYEIEDETDENCYNALVMTRLRTAEGLAVGDVPAPFRDHLFAEAEHLIERGSLVYNDYCLYIPESQWLVSDATIRDLMI